MNESMMHTAHGGQLARLVGSPVTFVALTATADKANRKKVEIERIVLVLRDYGQRKEEEDAAIKGQGQEQVCSGLCLPLTCVSKYLYVSIFCCSSIEDFIMTFRFQFRTGICTPQSIYTGYTCSCANHIEALVRRSP